MIVFKTSKRSYGIVKTIKDKFSKPLFFTASPNKNVDEWKKKTLKQFKNGDKFFDVDKKIISDFENSFWVVKEKIKFWKDFQPYLFLNDCPGLNYTHIYSLENSKSYLGESFVNVKFIKNFIDYFKTNDIKFLKLKEFPGNYVKFLYYMENINDIVYIDGKDVNSMKFAYYKK